MTRIPTSQRKVSRRDFLKLLGAASSYAMLPLGMEQLLPPTAESWVNIPPSLMLHSPNGKAEFLPPLLDCLQEAGFTTTTYRAWYGSILANRPIQHPVILSIDDITLVRSGPSTFETFVQMKDWIKAAGGTAVYGVITTPVFDGQPQREQDEDHWDMMQVWVEEGFELATHTSYHSTFSAPDTGPRSDFSAVDYEAEIVDSAALIEMELQERGLDYQVETLILPFGSGYSYHLPAPAIHAGIVAACQQAHIKFVIGIPHGREPLPRERFENPDDVLYLGRMPPAYITGLDGHQSPHPAQTAAWLQSW